MMDDFTFTDLTITESTKMSDVVAADVEDIPVDDPVVKYTICQQSAVNSGSESLSLHLLAIST